MTHTPGHTQGDEKPPPPVTVLEQGDMLLATYLRIGAAIKAARTS
jgi:hypothetical protein